MSPKPATAPKASSARHSRPRCADIMTAASPTMSIRTGSVADRRTAFARMALGALGVVYGDIGTSPLYTVQQTFGAQGVLPTHDNVLGVLSLVFWSLVLIVAVKYAGF